MILKLINEVRDLIDFPWKNEVLLKNNINWEKMYVCLNTLEDTQSAVDCYKKLSESKEIEFEYLYLYGVLQALFLQQDAILNLHSALNLDLFLKDGGWKTNYPDMYAIRELRNEAVGHPTKKGSDDSFHTISMRRLDIKSFILVSSYPKSNKKDEYKEIKILEVIQKQEKILIKMLKAMKKNLNKEIEEHKSKFKDDPIQLKVKMLPYHIRKFNEKLNRPDYNVDMDFDMICECMDVIKVEVEKRYCSLDPLFNLELDLQDIDYILKRLKRDMIDRRIEDKKELRVFVSLLNYKVRGIFDAVKEIDSEFGYGVENKISSKNGEGKVTFTIR